MGRLPTPTALRCYPLKNTNGNLNSLSRKLQCLSLLKCCSSMQELRQIHAQLHISGLHTDGFLVSEVLRFCALSKFGNLDYAQSVLRHSIDHQIPSFWNNLIRGYASSDSPRKAISIFLDMRSRGPRPNKLTFPFLFKACAEISALDVGRQIQAEVVKNGLDSDVYVQNTLIHFYGSCQEVVHARKVFDGMSLRTVVSWNSTITACVDNSRLDESIKLFYQMRESGFEPDEATMVVLLSVCAELGNLSFGRWVHSQVIGKGCAINCRLGTALVDMYAKCGSVGCARLVFNRMSEKNVWTWTAMILGLAQHGLAKESLMLFTQMRYSSIKPNCVTFLGVLCACSHAGYVDDGYRFFHDMEHVYGIKPMMTHYGAMVDVLGRSGRLNEAWSFIKKMPVEPDPVVLRTLLSACSIHDTNGSSGVGEKVTKRLLELEPSRCGNLVMVANMYAEVGLWEEAGNMRKVMRRGGLRKMAGESCIELGGSIHRFFCGNDSRHDFEEIYRFLDGLNLHMRIIDHAEVNILPI